MALTVVHRWRKPHQPKGSIVLMKLLFIYVTITTFSLVAFLLSLLIEEKDNIGTWLAKLLGLEIHNALGYEILVSMIIMSHIVLIICSLGVGFFLVLAFTRCRANNVKDFDVRWPFMLVVRGRQKVPSGCGLPVTAKDELR